MATFPDEPTEEERLEEVSQDDGQTPFRPADDVPGSTVEIEGFDREELDDTHPVTDAATNIDEDEAYDEGEAGAAEAREPNAGSAVVGYDPSKDKRRAAM
jgi:hypothetical protein